MIAKVTSGSSGRGLIRYLFGPGQANEHTDQRVITSGLELGGDALAGGNLSSQEIADIGAGLDAAHEAFGTNPKGGHIFHVSLSLPPGDRQLSDDQWAQIAHKAMEALGLEGEGMQPAAWVAVGHGTSANGNQHIHIAASLVRVDGSRVNTWQSKQTLSRVCAEIETDYGLTVIEGRAGKGMPGLSRAELERTAREQMAEPPRHYPRPHGAGGIGCLQRRSGVRPAIAGERSTPPTPFRDRRERGRGRLFGRRQDQGRQHADLVRRREAGQGPDPAEPPPVLGGLSGGSQVGGYRMERHQGGGPRERSHHWHPRRLATSGGGHREGRREVEASAGVRPRRMARGIPRSRRPLCRLVETLRTEQPRAHGSSGRRIGSLGAEPAR